APTGLVHQRHNSMRTVFLAHLRQPRSAKRWTEQHWRSSARRSKRQHVPRFSPLRAKPTPRCGNRHRMVEPSSPTSCKPPRTRCGDQYEQRLREHSNQRTRHRCRRSLTRLTRPTPFPRRLRRWRNCHRRRFTCQCFVNT
ncbi:MAG: hypothetical protein JHC63_10085, partial [Acidimicrobiia bacterium]|nr:hypothetical protein [Acidimicrobiia bacterium]